MASELNCRGFYVDSITSVISLCVVAATCAMPSRPLQWTRCVSCTILPHPPSQKKEGGHRLLWVTYAAFEVSWPHFLAVSCVYPSSSLFVQCSCKQCLNCDVFKVPFTGVVMLAVYVCDLLPCGNFSYLIPYDF